MGNARDELGSNGVARVLHQDRHSGDGRAADASGGLPNRSHGAGGARRGTGMSDEIMVVLRFVSLLGGISMGQPLDTVLVGWAVSLAARVTDRGDVRR